MKVFWSTDFRGFYPVGTAAVVVARNEDEARRLLRQKILDHGLPDPFDEFTVTELDISSPKAVILRDGDY